MTLVEVLVATALMALLLTEALGFVLTARHMVGVAEGREDVLRAASTALSRVGREIRFADSQGITAGTDPGRISFQSFRDRAGQAVTDKDGEVVVQRVVIFYHHDGLLLRKELTSKKALTAEALSAACDGGGEVLARGVTSFVPSFGTVFARFRLTVQRGEDQHEGQLTVICR